MKTQKRKGCFDHQLFVPKIANKRSREMWSVKYCAHACLRALAFSLPVNLFVSRYSFLQPSLCPEYRQMRGNAKLTLSQSPVTPTAVENFPVSSGVHYVQAHVPEKTVLSHALLCVSLHCARTASRSVDNDG